MRGSVRCVDTGVCLWALVYTQVHVRMYACACFVYVGGTHTCAPAATLNLHGHQLMVSPLTLGKGGRRVRMAGWAQASAPTGFLASPTPLRTHGETEA